MVTITACYPGLEELMRAEPALRASSRASVQRWLCTVVSNTNRATLAQRDNARPRACRAGGNAAAVQQHCRTAYIWHTALAGGACDACMRDGELQPQQQEVPRMLTAREMLRIRQAQPALSTGSPCLDALLSGGLIRGTVTELVGTLAAGAPSLMLHGDHHTAVA